MRYRDRIPFLGALALFFSAVELFIPRILPFFKIGLANIPVLAALDMPLQGFMILLVVKAIGTTYVSGTLFSVFFIMSVIQTLLSGLTMYALRRFFRNISIYSVSMAGALVSVLAQISVASLYAGKGVFMMLPLMLVISLPASILTAWISGKITIPDDVLIPETEKGEKNSRVSIVAFALSALMIMLSPSVPSLLLTLIVCLSFQRATERRIMVTPHILILIFMIISSVFTPSGKILFHIASWPVTEGALADGIERSLRLSSAIALSQGFSRIIRPTGGITGRTLAIFDAMLSSFRVQKGSLWEKVRNTLSSTQYEKQQKTDVNVPLFTSIAVSVLLTAITVVACFFL